MTEYDAHILKAMLKGDFSEVTDSWLHEMKARYPFFPVPEALSLRADSAPVDPHERAAAIARIATALGGDGEAVANLVSDEHNEESRLYPEDTDPDRPTTENAIDKFLNTYGNNADNETETLEKLIFNPVADYSQQLAREAEALPDVPDPEGNSQDDRINRFILSVNGGSIPETDDEEIPVEAPTSEKDIRNQRKKQNEKKSSLTSAEEPAENSMLSESLAKIYIKTGRYERAYEILARLSLAFPEKNAYFADQLRFLRKLMLVESYRKKSIENQNN